MDGEENPFSPQCKEKLFYLPDDPYYFPNASIQTMLDFYKKQYPGLDADSAVYMAESLNLDRDRPIRTFSKGMKRQTFLILALCSRTKYLFCDEVFDGLDPIAADIICGNIAILHKGGVVTAGDFRERTENVRKFQCVLPLETDLDRLRQHPSVVRFHEDARFITLVTRGNAEEIRKALEELEPIFLGEVPLSLEETFIAEMEGAGYDIRKVLQ